MADDPSVPNPGQQNSNLDFDRIKEEINSLETEIREDASERLAAQAVIKRLRDGESRLSRVVRDWRFSPEIVSSAGLDTVRRLLLAIYEILEDDLPRFRSLWEVYRGFRNNVRDGYSRSMDALSVFREVLVLYQQRDRRDRPLGEVGSDVAALYASRREMVSEISDFADLIEVLTERLDVAGRRRQRHTAL